MVGPPKLVDDLRSGLAATMAKPVGSGAVNLLAGYSSGEGAFGSLEAAYHATANLGLYAKAEASTALGIYGGVGLHLDF